MYCSATSSNRILLLDRSDGNLGHLSALGTHTPLLLPGKSQTQLNHSMVEVRRDLRRSSGPTPPALVRSPSAGCPGQHPDSFWISPRSLSLSSSERSYSPFIIQIINENAVHNRTQYWPLQYTTSYRPPTRLRTTDHHPVEQAVQPVFSHLTGCSYSTYFISLSVKTLWETVLNYWSPSR